MDRFEEEKRLAAKEAVKYVENKMTIGAGSGTTMKYFVEYLAERVADGLQVLTVPTSKETADLCRKLNIPVFEGAAVPDRIDLTIDGADEFDPQLNLIKGGGGDLLWEKIVASVSEREIIITDSRKRVSVLGKTFRLPVEVIPYASQNVVTKLKQLGIDAVIRMTKEERAFITDEGNHILDCSTGDIENPMLLAEQLSSIVGVVEHGLFLDIADMVIEGNQGEVYVYNAHNNVIAKTDQKATFDTILQKVQASRARGEVPVIEMDLDLTTFVTKERSIKGLKNAGKKYQIPEFVNPIFDLLPGYTREAWTNFISRNKLTEKYPHLRWMGEKDGKDGDSVYAAFHTEFWKTEYLALDTVTPGLPEYIRSIQKEGAVVVFVSGRWKEEQFEPTREVMRRAGIEDVPLFIGNPRHDGAAPVSDSQVKALHQPEIREKYGVPAVIIDDRKENRNAVIDANPGIEMLSVGCAIPGFSYDQEITGVPLKISTFIC